MTGFCKNCGNPLIANANFCSKCGTSTSSFYSNAGSSSDNLTLPMLSARTLSQVPAVDDGLSYSNADASSTNLALPTSSPKTSPQIPSTEYGSLTSGMGQQNSYEPFSPDLVPPSSLPPIPPRRRASKHLKTLIVGAILLLVLVSGFVYYATAFLPNLFHGPSVAGVLTRVSTPAPITYTYEAESSTNTFTGSATVKDCTNCSGHLKVGFVGDNNGTLQFNNVNVASSKAYILTIYYCSGENRNAFMSVNNDAGVQLVFSSTGDWIIVGHITTSIKLNAGNNTIKFYNPTGWAPDFDKITITA